MKALHITAALIAIAFASLVAAGIYFGSGKLAHFDPALYWYAVGSLVAALAVAYRFTVWAERPPSRMYFIRGFQLLFKRGPKLPARNKSHGSSAEERATLPSPVLEAGLTLGTQYVAQDFIRKRSTYRWFMHLCLSGGCTLAFAVTFPLVFGWIHFKPHPGNAEIYRVAVFGLTIDSFSVHSFKAFVMFNMLNIAAVLVMVGLTMAGWRRLTDAGERATQTFYEDILPLIIIAAVTVTGLMLTLSYTQLGGAGHGIIAFVHMISVLVLLFYIPFGKLFHMFQRTAHLFVRLYKRAGESGARAHCQKCGEDFASLMHVEDLKTVLDQLDFNYRYETGGGPFHYQDVCPPCRRKLLAVNQGASLGR